MKKAPFNPFFIRSRCKIACLIIAALWFVAFMGNDVDTALWAVYIYLMTNLLIETMLYRMFKLKESSFCPEKVIKKTFKLTAKELDKAALKTNALKLWWLGFNAVVFPLVHNAFPGIELLGWTLIFYGIIGAIILSNITYKMSKMPAIFYEIQEPYKELPIGIIASFNQSQGYGPINACIIRNHRYYY